MCSSVEWKDLEDESNQIIRGILPQPSKQFTVDWSRLGSRLLTLCLLDIFAGAQAFPLNQLEKRIEHAVGEALFAPISSGQNIAHELITAHVTWMLKCSNQLEQKYGIRVHEFQPGWGDPHPPGLTTTRVTVPTGQVYFAKPGRKPRQFNDQLERLSGHGIVASGEALPFRSGALYAAKRADSSPAVSRPQFWAAAGRFVSLALLDGFSDGHYENVIASDGRLTILDDETIGNPQVRASRRVEDTLLLETRAGVSGMIVGAFVAKSSPIRRRPHPGIVRRGTTVYLETFSRQSSIRCTLTDVYGTADENREAFLRGYQDAWSRCHELHDSVTSSAPGSRLVMRPTGVYSRIIERLLYVEGANELAYRYERCRSILSLLPTLRGEAALIDAEAFDLANGWIPRFLYCDRHTVATANGRLIELSTPLTPLQSQSVAQARNPLEPLRSWLTTLNI
ncbi:DUF4135 domain-containing protein [Dermabacter hominis]